MTTPTKDFFIDMMRAPLNRLVYKTCLEQRNDEGEMEIMLLELNEEFKMEYEKYISTLIKLIHSLDHFTYLPFVSMLRENKTVNVDGWYNGGIKLSNQRMIRFHIMKKDANKFIELRLGGLIGFWRYDTRGEKHRIIEGDEAYDEIIKLIESHKNSPNLHNEWIKTYYNFNKTK